MTQDDLQGRLAIFDRFQFEFSTGHLRKDGTRLRIEDKPTRLLSFLLHRAGTVVTREELQNLLWPDDVHVDYDHGLNKSINKLRFVLGDDPGDPRFIETLPRLGYRFIGPVEIVADARVVPTTVASASGPGAVFAPDLAPPPVDSTIPGMDQRSRGPAIIFLAMAAMAVVVGIAPSLVHGSRIGHLVRAMLAPHRTPTSGAALHALEIEKNGALDPLDEGFKLYAKDGQYVHVMRNSENHGVDRWRLVTDDQNYYYRPLTGAEKNFALQRDWKLTCTCAVEKGAAFANVDFGRDSAAPRFDIELLQEGNKYFVALTRQISPELQWEQKIEFAGVGDINHPHTYELRYDHLTKTANLWIDGQMQTSGYRGHYQFRENRGLYFGAVTYLDAKQGIGVFRTVRFDAY